MSTCGTSYRDEACRSESADAAIDGVCEVVLGVFPRLLIGETPLSTVGNGTSGSSVVFRGKAGVGDEKIPCSEATGVGDGAMRGDSSVVLFWTEAVRLDVRGSPKVKAEPCAPCTPNSNVLDEGVNTGRLGLELIDEVDARVCSRESADGGDLPGLQRFDEILATTSRSRGYSLS